MKRISLFALAIVFLLGGFGCSSSAQEPIDTIQPPTLENTQVNDAPAPQPMGERPTVETSSTKTLTFVPDSGKRIEMASNAGLYWQIDGSLAMVYENLAERGEYIARTVDATDYLMFAAGTPVPSEVPYRAMKLEDGTFRAFGFDPTRSSTNPCLTSMSSTDGINFTEDMGCRYTLQPDDQGSMGVYTTYAQADGKIVLLYIGDLHGKNNIRRAVSSDDGWTFTFDRGNVLGDDALGGGARSYVDERVIRLTDGTYYLVAMSSSVLYGFTSLDGDTFDPLPEFVLAPSDFAAIDSYISLNDPQITVLPDGRYRLYMTAISKEGTGPNDRGSADLVSATASALAE